MKTIAVHWKTNVLGQINTVDMRDAEQPPEEVSTITLHNIVD